jgi:acid phosphatase type 7
MRVILLRGVVAAGAALVLAVPATMTSASPRPTSSPATEAPEQATPPGESRAVALRRAPLVVAAGDIATDDRPDTTTARLVRRIQPRSVLVLGDAAYPDGSRRSYLRYYDPTWGTFKGRTRPAPGNHEYLRGTGSPHFYYRYFARQLPDRHGGRYYAYNVGTWRLYSLNCEIACGASSRQARWLRHDLATRGAGRHKLAYLHRPRYSCGKHGSSTVPATLWDRLLAARTDIVLAGHDHNYQRYPRMNSKGRPTRRGIMSFVVGTGGAALYHISGNEGPRGCSRARYVQSRRHGVLKLRLGATSFAWAFVTPHRRVLDSGRRPTVRRR